MCMVNVDLITGFLGSGKTTFIRGYIKYLLNKGERICILENDYGAINVDMLLLSDMQSSNLGIEMVAGGCDYDCHRRRFKTKLITMAILGYNRVIIEPSGIFDVDEFFDILHEDPLYDRYHIDNVLAIVDASLESNLSLQADYMLASQISQAGRVILSKSQLCDHQTILNTVSHINSALKAISCKREFSLDSNITCKDWNDFSDEDYALINSSGYRESAFVKKFSMDSHSFQSLFFMNLSIDKDTILSNIEKLWKDESVGNIIRIKGFVLDSNSWIEINSTKEITKVQSIEKGQSIIIVIGENLDEHKIDAYFPSEFSTIHTS